MRVKTLIFAIALSFCGGSTLSSDTTEQNQDDTTTTTTTTTVVDQDDTTTTTTVVEKDDQVEIPDAPSVNFDIQEITTGATVQIPINHDGALLHIGDMHAIQGDGEISGGGGIETGGTVNLRCKSFEKPEGMTWPRIINDEYIMTTAQGRPAEDAFRIALSEMLLWLENEFKINKQEGFMLLAQVLEARVTQFVNPTYTYLLKINKKYLI